MKSKLIRALDRLSSLKLTMVCLAAAMLLVFAGTLAQVRFGIEIVQERYFQSLFVWYAPQGEAGFRIPVFPGGHLIGGVLLANLIAAHVRRFRLTWKKLGIQLIHVGIIVMLAGGLLTDLFSVESFMRLSEGETRNYSEDFNDRELAVTDTSHEDFDEVTVIPEAALKPGKLFAPDALPFRIVVRDYMMNSELRMLDRADPEAKPAATQGSGSRIQLKEMDRATGMKQRDTRSAVIELIALPDENNEGGGLLGTWLVSDALGAPQSVEVGGKSWTLELRATRHYKPFSLTLHDFAHDKYLGTEIPKNFSSAVTLHDDRTGESREVLIYMNHPLRFEGETFYQAGFERGEDTSVLQVVRNPGIIAPYAGCIIVGAGLLLQFGTHLSGFARKRRNAAHS